MQPTINLARVNQHPPVHLQGWILSGQKPVIWLGSSSLVNHGGDPIAILTSYVLKTGNQVDYRVLGFIIGERFGFFKTLLFPQSSH
jgi:hypothetical protein